MTSASRYSACKMRVCVNIQKIQVMMRVLTARHAFQTIAHNDPSGVYVSYTCSG